jgi:hypothetical protein
MVVGDLEWHLYGSTYLGLPVDIAFSTLGSNTVLVIMLSAVDEHEALYENVFVPILQVTRPIE